MDIPRRHPQPRTAFNLDGRQTPDRRGGEQNCGFFGCYPEEIATEQLKIEEKQRVFGIIPNFYVVYDHDAVPLTPKLKFKLALKTSFDPVTIGGIALLAGIKQAADTPNYVQGAKGYGERFGAIAATVFPTSW